MKIQFKNVCPNIFIETPLKSDVWNQDFTVHDGMRYQFRGQSGKGKTSLLSFLLGYRSDYRGEIFINDKAIFELSIDEWIKLRREKVASIFQDLQLIDQLSVEENMSLIPKFQSGYGLSEGKKMLENLGMGEKWEQKVETLSFGQKQRVAIVRALCKPFELLICDEPFSHLDKMHKSKCIKLIEKRISDANAGIILTSLDGEDNLGLKSIYL